GPEPVQPLLTSQTVATAPTTCNSEATAADLWSAPSPPPRVTCSLFIGAFAEMLQIGRPLPLLGGHQLAIGAAHVDLALDLHIGIPLGADCLDPHDRPQLAIVALVRHSGAKQRVVIDRDVVMQDVGIGLVEIDALLDDALGIEMQGCAAGV